MCRTRRAVYTNEVKVHLVETLPENVQRAVRSALEKNAFDIVVLFLGDSQTLTDYFVLCSARSTRQVRAIVDEIHQQLKSSQEKPIHVEGYDHGEWVLVDFFDFVVHVFTPDTRHFYDLERLWGNATRIQVPDDK
jgi:ribosome-associated protein